MIGHLLSFTKSKAVLLFLLSLFSFSFSFSQNDIVTENNLPGTAPSVWDISGAGDLSIQGFATDISVNKGQTVHFKIKTSAANYTINIYRLGYYQGNGARFKAAITPSVSLPQTQPADLYDVATGKTDCSNWAESASWAVPAEAVSGIYIAKLTRSDNNGSSHIVFIVRDDAGTSKILFKTADATWQAYNNYGGNSLYVNGSGTSVPGFNHATKVSYNRPFYTRNGGGGGGAAEDWLFNAEFPMLRWLERNGYDVSYTTDVDMDRSATAVTPALHKILLTAGHDEYWSAAQRSRFENARNAGVSLAFFDGNEVYWKTRWEDNNRTLVCYKEGTLGENVCNAKCDPMANTWTGNWRDGCGAAYGSNDGCRPENALSGQISWDGTTSAIQVPDTYKNLRFWRNTAIASLGAGQTATLPAGTLGYEWDWEQYNASYPSGRITMSNTTVNGHTHKLSLYRHSSGALVFGAGTVQWSWGLDGTHDRGGSTADVRMQQATVNLLADMGVQPGGVLQSGLSAATASTDTQAPASAITFPADGASFPSGTQVTITGTASDVGGVVAGVEVSVDGGTTWQPATGTTNWSYIWTPAATGNTVIKSRAFDDIGNIESEGTAPSATAISVTVTGAAPGVCPCTVFQTTDVPASPRVNDGTPIELGMKFRTVQNGVVTGVRFYKGAGTTGSHIGHLWSSTGILLAEATFTNESASGWQQVSFSTPVSVTANTTYVVSFFSSSGDYAFTNPFFTTAVVNGPLRGLANGEDGPNGVYKYSSVSAFPSDNYQSSNYSVDAVFNTNAIADVNPPTIISISPYNGSTGVSVTATLNVTFNESLDASTVNSAAFEIRDDANALVPAILNYNSATHLVTITPISAFAPSKTYTVKVKGGAADPRVKDLSGNALAADFSFSFTTSSVSLPTPGDGAGGPILVISSASNPFSRYNVEILRAEGLNEFTAMDISQVTAAILNSYDVVVLGEMPASDLPAAKVALLSDWVNAGGTFISMKPNDQLYTLLGITPLGNSLSDKYLLVNTASGPGTGIVNQTIQYHGVADEYILNGATSLATLYADANTATTYPAVTSRSVGANGGTAVAFTYDLAKSVVYTRQGNPAWAGQKRDGQIDPIRSDDQFFPDWIDFNKVAIPQADEQQHLLSNIILTSNLHRKPLPKFWFLPKDFKAAIVMTGDNHGDNGMKPRFDINISESTPGCSVDDWECIRSTGYLYPGTSFTSAQAKQYNDLGFEVALHVNTNCQNFTSAEYQNFITTQSAVFQATYPDVPKPTTNRNHCIAWPAYSVVPEVELANGIRLDANYYYWPASWINNRPGMFTGSGMPMRFSKADGTLIDCYQATTQMPDESGEVFPAFCNALLDKAVGAEGYYGVFTTNIHFDNTNSAEANAIVASAKAHGIPVVSAKQMLTWLDGRNSSSFGPMTWSGNTLSFSISTGARNLRAMVPVASQGGQLTGITKNGGSVAFTKATIKGVQYAFFDASSANYTAIYGVDNVGPIITQIVATPNAGGTATITWTTDEAADSKVDYGSSSGSLTLSANNGSLVTNHSITLNGLTAGSTYFFRVTSKDGLLNSTTEPVAASAPLSFVMPSVCAIDQFTADFLQSTSLNGSKVIVSGEGDGSVILQPVLNEDFSGNIIPVQWTEGLFNPGATTVNNGFVTVNGTHIFSNSSYGPGSIIEFNATYNLGSYQNIGFSSDQQFNDAPWITIGQGGNPDGNLYARASDGTSILLGSLLGSPHHFRIIWNVNNFQFYVDDAVTPTATINLAVSSNMFIQISDVLNNDGSLSVDWLRVTPYFKEGIFTSRVLDGGSVKNWGAVTWNATTPPGTSISVSIRTSNSLTPDNAWSAFKLIPSSGSPVGVASRYIQYQATLSATDSMFTPVFKDLSIACSDAETTPPVIVTKNVTIQSDANGLASIQPQDVIVSVTDESGIDNSSVQVSQLQFSCSDNHQTYVAPINTGNQNWEGTLGMEFRVNLPTGIIINQLGAFDHMGDGIMGSGIRVAIFDKATQTIVPGLDVLVTGNGDGFKGNYRMKNITPVKLLPGDYVVVSQGYNSLELNGNSVNINPPFPTGDLANGAISYTGSSLYGFNNPGIFTYPTHPDQYPNQYLAGNFVYSTGNGGNEGDNVVIVTAKDNNGNQAQATATVTLVCNNTAVVTISPASQSVCEGTPVTFVSNATGNPTPTVQWQTSTNGTVWNNIAGATAASYSFNPTFADNNKQYRAVWTSQNSVNSLPATLTVKQSPVAGITNNTGSTVLTCATGAISVTATGGGTYKWEDNSTSATRNLTAAGTYTVTVTGTGGCTATKSIVITSNKTAPVITPLTGGTLSCSTASISVTASATGQGALSYAWSGGTQGASANIRVFNTAGTYTVTVTDAANGCSSIASVNIGSSVNVPVAGITNNTGSTVLTCTTGSISVTATGGGTYTWEDNSTSATRNLTAAGTYTVTVTGTGGCTATKSIVITSNKTAPVITPLTGGTLTCTTTSISVTASATGQGALSYAWSGGTQGASANIRVFNTAGTYTVTVTDAANGCSSIASVNIGSSVGLPVAGITNNTGSTVLTCTTGAISITATGGGTYTWEDNSTSATRNLTAAGTYTVTVTGTGGCTATKSIVITSNKTAPVITPLTGGTLTCTTTSISVTASATGQGALSYVWSGGTQGASANVRVFTAAGNYTVTVTDAANGCSSTASVSIANTAGTPVAGITNNTGSTVLTCTTGSISVTATGGGTYKWEDNSTSATRNLTAAGTYTVTVTGTGGCTATKSIVITSNKTAPVITPLTGGTLTCTTTSISVTASATGQGALSYVWSGGTQGASANVRVFTAAGNYTVTVTDAANGCSSTASVSIANTAGTPVAGITNNTGSTVLTCATGAISVTATGGGTYKWEDNSTSATRNLTAAGTYTVTVTGTGGCTATKSIVITSNKTAPVITPLTGGTLTCTTTSISVTASTTGQGALSYAWSGGTQGASANIRVFNTAGTYTVTVTDAANGCASTASVNIGGTTASGISIINNSGTSVLTCNTPGISLTATGGGTYKWNDNSTSASKTVTTPGTYSVTVTQTGGCVATTSITITSNKTAPTIAALTGGTITCASPSVSVTASATGQGAISYAWSGGTQGASANVRVFTAAGNYTVTVTDAANGCSSTASVSIASTASIPVAGITNNTGSTVLTCITGAINVTATGGGSYKWENSSTSATRALTAAGTYTVTVTSTGGCTATKSIAIANNKTAPVITPLSGGNISCTTSSVSVTASATGQGALSYAWSGGTQGASSNIRIFTSAGTYTVTVTDAANGCSSTASVVIGSNMTPPSLTSSLTPTATSEITFNYSATSSISGSTFSWSRAAVTGISNSASTGSTNGVSETLINTTRNPINVIYVYTIKYNSCTNAQNVTVKVNPSTISCINTSSIVASFSSLPVYSGKSLWLDAVFTPTKMGTTGKVNFYIYNSKVTFNNNNSLVTINLPYSHVVYDPAATSASTQFVNNVWETVVPLAFTKNAFMNGVAYPVPSGGIMGGMKNTSWTADIAIDKPGVELQWKNTYTQYSYLPATSGLNVKPIDGSSQNPYNNQDEAGSVENYSAYYNYNVGYSDSKTVTCNSSMQRQATEMVKKEVLTEEHLAVSVMPNPSTTYFTLSLRGNSRSPMMVRVLDVYGRVIGVHEKISSNTTLRLGEMWQSGIYFAEVTQGKDKVIVKMVKVK